jgi:hypothetical protein
MAKSLRRAAAGLCVILAVVLLAGCGGATYPRAPVKGRVMTWQGQPATGGVVVFQPVDAPGKTGRPAGHPGTASHGTVEQDGTFTLTAMDGKSGDGAVVGPHLVIFRMPPTKRGALLAEERANLSPDEVRAAESDLASRPVYPPLPASDRIQPGEVEVKPGENMFEFTLPKK